MEQQEQEIIKNKFDNESQTAFYQTKKQSIRSANITHANDYKHELSELRL